MCQTAFGIWDVTPLIQTLTCDATATAGGGDQVGLAKGLLSAGGCAGGVAAVGRGQSCLRERCSVQHLLQPLRSPAASGSGLTTIYVTS